MNDSRFAETLRSPPSGKISADVLDGAVELSLNCFCTYFQHRFTTNIEINFYFSVFFWGGDREEELCLKPL